MSTPARDKGAKRAGASAAPAPKRRPADAAAPAVTDELKAEAGAAMAKRERWEQRYTNLRSRYWLIREMYYKTRLANRIARTHNSPETILVRLFDVSVAYDGADHALRVLREVEAELAELLCIRVGGARETTVPPAATDAEADSLREAGVPLGNESAEA